MRCFSVRVGKKASRAWPAPTRGVVGFVGAPWGAMLFRPCPESIAGMARSYRAVWRGL